MTLFAIVVTANHFWIDALGGAIALGLGYLIGGRLLTNAVDRRTTRRRSSRPRFVAYGHQRTVSPSPARPRSSPAAAAASGA